MSVPQVMISSTFFDLKQVRADLSRAIEELGCNPLASELHSFPIDPDAETIENCRRRVERDADILVLIIGRRYGFVDSRSARSVTNLEYLAARAKGIPIYAFVDSRILTLLPRWKANKEGDFRDDVDDCRVFEFLEEVREQHKIWMSEFDLAEDIARVLRFQLAHLALQGAQLIKRAHDDREISILNQLRGLPLKIALEKPPGWQYILFAETLNQEIETKQELNTQRRLGIAYGEFHYIDQSNLRRWFRSRTAELQFLVGASNRLINEELHHAWKKDPVDVELLVQTARSLAVLYEEALEWGLRVRRCVGEKEVTSFAETLEHLADDIVRQLKEFGPTIKQAVEERAQAVSRGESGAKTIYLDLALPGIDEAQRALEQLVQRLILDKQA
jgi:hypothetical protein